MKPPKLLLVSLSGLLSFAVGGCGDNHSTQCGAGTVAVNGQCVPDGSIICQQGTTFDMATGTCVIDPSACAEGTVLVGGECVPEDDTLTADLEEAAEPNDAAGAGSFDVPALDDDITIHGCITPRGGARDQDVWIMSASGPALLEITADGVGGLAAGFIVQDNLITSLPNYFRAGINLTGDTSRRQVFLPTAGTYLLVMDDSRAILLDEVAGGADTCYYGTIKQVALPSATALTAPETTGDDVGNVQIYNYTADAEGDILRAIQSTTSESMSPAFVVMNGSTLVQSLAPDDAAGIPPIFTAGLSAGTTLSLVVDMEYNFSPNPQPFTFDVLDLSAQALPTDGSTITVTNNRDGSVTGFPVDSFSYLYFDVAADGDLVQFDITSSIPVDMVLVRRNVLIDYDYDVFDIIAVVALGDSAVSSFTGEFAHFLQAGRYYLMVRDPSSGATSGSTFMITSTVATVTPAAVTYGTASTGQTLPASGTAFHTMSLTDPTWVEFAATGTNWGTNVSIAAFDQAREGVVGLSYTPTFSGSQPADGSNPFGRIMIGDTRAYFLAVRSSTTPGTGPTYDLTVQDRPHTDLMTITPGTPIVLLDEPVVGGSNSSTSPDAKRYLVMGPAASNLSINVTPDVTTSDLIIRRRDVSESSVQSADVGFDGDPETLSTSFGAPPANWVAFTVGDWDSADSTFDLTVDATVPAYTITTGTLPYDDACAGGTVLTLNGSYPGDEAQSDPLDLPSGWSFSYFDDSPTQFVVNTNGFLAFLGTPPPCSGISCGYSNAAMPSTAQPNGVVAPYWDDLELVQVCRKDTATTMTIQWEGERFLSGLVVQTQVVVHSDGVIDVIYGAGQEVDGASATVGVENIAGDEAIQSSYNQAVVSASTSLTFTPSP